MRKIFFAFFVLTAAFAIYFAFSSETSHDVTVTVSKIVDGDTIRLSNGDVVRLIGVDAPEHNQPLFSEVNKELEKILGKPVRLESDVSNKDAYGRLLRYVFLDDYFVNLEMIRSGLASAYIVEPDSKYAKKFLEAESYAKSRKIGIWEESEFANCIRLDKFHYNAKGDDAKNMNDEYVIFSNLCESISLDGWRVSDVQGNVYTFGKTKISANTTIILFSGEGNSSANAVYWKSKYPIWNNNGDAITLRDSSGRIVLHESYSNE